ncbi:Guanosine-5'-triphosphate,3'-diphosphate pyrophosphatase [Phycisphaerae bacterium RAS1]|nr:Guanosine-5'-triphosphate,3'-diphosphate pyrophosphatase [Phycisphaerae bacterium RAS1]
MNRPAWRDKWVEGLHGDTPCAVAARVLLRLRLCAVSRLLPEAAPGIVGDPRAVEAVHQLRVATRRAAAVLRNFKRYCDARVHRKLRRRLRSVRSSVAAARRRDVHAEIIAADAARAEPALRDAYAALLQDVRREDRRVRVLGLPGRRRLNALRRKLLRPMRAPEACDSAVLLDVTAAAGLPAYTLSELAGKMLPEELAAVRNSPPAALRELPALHALRLRGKRLRYGLEVFAGCFPSRFRDEIYPRIAEMQTKLGDINDRVELVQRAEALLLRLDVRRGRQKNGEAGAIRSADIARVCGRYVAERDRLHAEFVQYWAAPETIALFKRLDAMIRLCCAPRRMLRRPLHRSLLEGDGMGFDPDAGPPPTIPQHHRVAAIDVGTNSIRLVVAESDPTVRFRVIEDVKETTRLGAGLYVSGRLDAGAVERSIAALRRMRQIAVDYHVDRIRAVGTSAVREASNGGEFVELARKQAGIEIEPIDADEEARLAFVSVASSFDLDERRIAVADIGGGSTELVFSAGGVIDAIHKLPLGGVRLTEQFSRRGGGGKYYFAKMRRSVDDKIREIVGEAPYPLEMIIGTGGTFTSLARAVLLRGTAAGDGRFPFAVRGLELTHRELLESVNWLRRMTLEERRRVPGINAQRAEIIVAGLCIIERLMKRLRVHRLRVHDGGIRDGLLSRMIDELGAVAVRPPHFSRSALAAVRAYARRCRYDKPHSEHVARLAQRLFDQLSEAFPDAGGVWAGREARDLLHAAALLHDVGWLIAERDHEKHSYDMILHADLDVYSRRELEIIANIARYHRGRGPRLKDPHLRNLNEDDQRLVWHLAGILRIADGLDREHLQDVTDATVSVDAERVTILAGASDRPDVNLRIARRKADVFESAFHTPVVLGWSPATTAGRELVRNEK